MIYYGFYHFLSHSISHLRIYILCFEYILEFFQIYVRFGVLWRSCSHLELKDKETCSCAEKQKSWPRFEGVSIDTLSWVKIDTDTSMWDDSISRIKFGLEVSTNYKITHGRVLTYLYCFCSYWYTCQYVYH